jgi:hypothetical protein
MLERNHYHRMTDFLPESSRPVRLWSVKSGFATYAPRDGFYKIRTLQPSESHGVIEISHDLHHCVITRFQQPDGCATAATYDYRSLQPRRITDPNGNVQEGLFDAFGQVLATSFYGDEQHTRRGFKPLAQFKQPAFNSPTAAISQSRDALQDAATALYYAPFSWMGCVSKAALADTDWLARCVSNGDLLPAGHICASARVRLAELQTLSADDLKLKNELEAAPREPVHIATLVADRDPDDDQKQIRIAVTCFDGFGRTLQSKQLVEPGLAYVVDAKGDLTLTDGAPKEQVAARRWRVSERVEYNSKGLAVRIYRPYFADQHRRINDVSLRQFGHYDRQFYDALGRPTLTRLARQAGLCYMRRHTRHPWYSVDEDENDTLQEVMSEHAATAGGGA